MKSIVHYSYLTLDRNISSAKRLENINTDLAPQTPTLGPSNEIY